MHFDDDDGGRHFSGWQLSLGCFVFALLFPLPTELDATLPIDDCWILFKVDTFEMEHL